MGRLSRVHELDCHNVHYRISPVGMRGAAPPAVRVASLESRSMSAFIRARREEFVLLVTFGDSL